MPHNESLRNEKYPLLTKVEAEKILGFAALQEISIFGVDTEKPQNYDSKGRRSLGSRVLGMLGEELEKPGVDFGYDAEDEGTQNAELEYGNTRLPPSTILEKEPNEASRIAQLGKRVLAAA